MAYPAAAAVTWSLPESCAFVDPATGATANPTDVQCSLPGTFRVDADVDGSPEYSYIILFPAKRSLRWTLSAKTVDGSPIPTHGSRLGPRVVYNTRMELRFWPHDADAFDYAKDPRIVGPDDLPDNSSRLLASMLFFRGYNPVTVFSNSIGIVPLNEPTWDRAESCWKMGINVLLPGVWPVRVSAALDHNSPVEDETYTFIALPFVPADPENDKALLPSWLSVETDPVVLQAIDVSQGFRPVMVAAYGAVGTTIAPSTPTFTHFLSSFGRTSGLKPVFLPTWKAFGGTDVTPLPLSNLVGVSLINACQSGTNAFVSIQSATVRLILEMISFPVEANVTPERVAAAKFPDEADYPANYPHFVMVSDSVDVLQEGAMGLPPPVLQNFPADVEAGRSVRSIIYELTTITAIRTDGSIVEYSLAQLCYLFLLVFENGGTQITPPTDAQWHAWKIPLAVHTPPGSTDVGAEARFYYHPPAPSHLSIAAYAKPDGAGGEICTASVLTGAPVSMELAPWGTTVPCTVEQIMDIGLCEPRENGRFAISPVTLGTSPTEFFVVRGTGIRRVVLDAMVSMNVHIVTLDGAQLDPADTFVSSSIVLEGLGVGTTRSGRCIYFFAGTDMALESLCPGGAINPATDTGIIFPSTEVNSFGFYMNFPLTNGLDMTHSYGGTFFQVHAPGSFVYHSKDNKAVGDCPLDSYRATAGAMGGSLQMDKGESTTVEVRGSRVTDSFGDLQPYITMVTLRRSHLLERGLPTEGRLPLAMSEKLVASTHEGYLNVDLSVTGGYPGLYTTSTFSLGMPLASLQCVVDPTIVRANTQHEFTSPLTLAIEQTDKGGSFKAQPTCAPQVPKTFERIFVDPDIKRSPFALAVSGVIAPMCKFGRRMFYNGVSYDPADCPDFAPGGKYYHRRPPSGWVQNRVDTSLYNADGSFDYPLARLGCPIDRIHVRDLKSFRPNIQILDGGNVATERVTAARVYYELQGRTDWQSSLFEDEVCKYKSYSIAEAMRLHPSRTPWGAPDNLDMWDCNSPEAASHGPAPHERLDVYGIQYTNVKTGAPVVNLLESVLDGGDGTFIFGVTIVDPSYSTCDLYTEFAIDVYGAEFTPAFVAATCGIVISVIAMLLLASWYLSIIGRIAIA